MQPQLEVAPQRPKISPLLLELFAARRRLDDPELAATMGACGLQTDRGPLWGVDFVTVDQHHYEPAPDGRPAVIVPCFDGGELVDLVAVGLRARTCRTRTGVCTVLGRDAIDDAKDCGGAVEILTDPIAWLQNGRRGACVVDWRAARHELADVPSIECTSQALADRIDRAMRKPVDVPQIVVSDPRAALVEKRKAEANAQAEWAAKTAQHMIAKATTETHPYLDSIGFPAMRGLVHEGALLVPMRLDGRAVSLLQIDSDGKSRTLSGGRTEGASFIMGSGRDEVLCASYAAALSIRAALSAMHMPARVTCCFTADNMAAIAERRLHAIVLADTDRGDANDLHKTEGLPALQRVLIDLLQTSEPKTRTGT